VTYGTPLEYTGSPTQRHANWRSHNFQGFGPDDEERCLACDCRPGGTVAYWPCGATIPTTVAAQAPRWWASLPTIIAMGRDMVRAGWLADADAVQEYYEHPHAWDAEYHWWDKAGRPDSAAAWEQACHRGWIQGVPA
jgi:hypothetical protein